MSALRQRSPVIVDVPADIRHSLMLRYFDMSMRNGRLAVVALVLMLFGIAYEVPLLSRLIALTALLGMSMLRDHLARRALARMDPADPRSGLLHDLLVLATTLMWCCMPLLLQGRVSPPNLLGVIYGGMIALAIVSVSYISALPASVLITGVCALPLVVFMLRQETLVYTAMGISTVAMVLALLARVRISHGTLVQALKAERENALLVQELQGYRRALESENATLGSSLRDASHAASRDSLTNVYNRRYMDSFAQPLVEAVRAHGEQVTLCLLDVDHFKHVNDLHGHLVGDEVLKAIAGLLGARLRDFDCLARYGGEEFVILLRRCDIGRGRRVAEALRHNVARAEIETDVGIVPVTVSVGVAQWSAGETLDEVVHRADRALYRAKQTGRDRVELDANDALRLYSPVAEPTFPGGF